MKFNTKIIHPELILRHNEKLDSRIINPTILDVSTSDKEKKTPDHILAQNKLQDNIAILENSEYAFCFSSIKAAVDAVLKLFNAGDEIICSNSLLNNFYYIFIEIYKQYGLKFHFTDLNEIEESEKFINQKTRMIWIQTPDGYGLSVTDISKISRTARNRDILLCVDSTFASPYLQNPLQIGADIVMHSLGEYFLGSKDIKMGLLVLNNHLLADRIAFVQSICDTQAAGGDVSRAIESIKTLHLRMDRHCLNTEIVAHFLQKHDQVENIYWPGLKNNPHHCTAKKQMRGFGANISFSIKNSKNIASTLGNFKIFKISAQGGGMESAIEHPWSMTYSHLSEKERLSLGISTNLIHLSIGLEDAYDLIFDLNQFLNSTKQNVLVNEGNTQRGH